MTFFFKFCLIAWASSLHYCQGMSFESYLNTRENLIQQEYLMTFGAKLNLEEDEITANECLMAAKNKEMHEGFKSPSKFLPAINFLKAREEIEKSEVYKIIRKMPKGSVFHAHTTAMGSLDFIVKNLTHMPYLYACLDNDKLRFRFFETATNATKECDWQDMETFRVRNELDDSILAKKYLEMSGEGTSQGPDETWENFENIFDTLSGLIKYRPAFERYIIDALQELYDDNVMYVEVRSPRPKLYTRLYELNGRTYSSVESIGILKNLVDRFTADHPGFMGAKLIYSFWRGLPYESFDEQVKIFREAKAAYPEFIVGFDLVGQEDKGHALFDFGEKLIEIGNETNFFFHAGETNWYGMESDENLFDAVLLHTKRIGHGYALLKHPKLMAMVKKRKIAIELSPISNQVLKLVADMRNHPASYFFAENFPVVVSNDDPSFWNATGLSYDFYEAFVGMMSRRADLRALKQLAINSIEYSTMNSTEKTQAYDIWNSAWKKFVKYLAYEHKCVKSNVYIF